MSYLEKIIKSNPNFKQIVVKKKSKGVIFYYSNKMLGKAKLTSLPLDSFYLLSVKLILYTFCLYQCHRILKQTDKGFEKRQLKLFPSEINPLILKKRSLTVFLTVGFFINELVIIIRFLKVLLSEKQFKYLKLGMLLVGGFFILVPNFKIENETKYLRTIKSLKTKKDSFLFFLIFIYFTFFPFYSLFVPKTSQTQTQNLPINRIWRRVKIDSIALQGSLRLGTNSRNEKIDKIIPSNSVISYRSEPGKLLCYKANGKIIRVHKFHKKEFSPSEIQENITWVNKLQQKQKINQGKKSNKREEYFHEFIKEEKKEEKKETKLEEFTHLNDNNQKI